VALAQSLMHTLGLPSEAQLSLGLAAGLRHWSAVSSSTQTSHALLSAEAAAATGGEAASEALLAQGGPLTGLMRGGAGGEEAAAAAAQVGKRERVASTWEACSCWSPDPRAGVGLVRLCFWLNRSRPQAKLLAGQLCRKKGDTAAAIRLYQVSATSHQRFIDCFY
jgi:hypothetical protein